MALIKHKFKKKGGGAALREYRSETKESTQREAKGNNQPEEEQDGGRGDVPSLISDK